MKKYYFNTNLKFTVKEENNLKLNPNQIRINMKNCGICGSDIHYFLHGENGGRKIQEPLMSVSYTHLTLPTTPYV